MHSRVRGAPGKLRANAPALRPIDNAQRTTPKDCYRSVSAFTKVQMETNALPHFDDSINATGCCPKFNPEGWDGTHLHFSDKAFARATSKAVMHIPIDMGQVFERVQKHIADAEAYAPESYVVLSRGLSPWADEHLFAITAPVPQEEAVTLSGDFITKVFEGPYRQMKTWYQTMDDLAKAAGSDAKDIYFIYTTSPKCAKAYGKNYVVGFARTGP